MSERGVNTDVDWESRIKEMEQYGVGLEKQHSTLLTQYEQEEAEHEKTKHQLQQKKVEGKRQQQVRIAPFSLVRRGIFSVFCKRFTPTVTDVMS